MFRIYPPPESSDLEVRAREWSPKPLTMPHLDHRFERGLDRIPRRPQLEVDLDGPHEDEAAVVVTLGHGEPPRAAAALDRPQTAHPMATTHTCEVPIDHGDDRAPRLRGMARIARPCRSGEVIESSMLRLHQA